MTVDPKVEFKFEHHWGGEDNWYTKGKRWANKQNFPINHLALGMLEWLWKLYIEERVKQEMESVDRQAEEIIKQWEKEEKQEPIIESKPSDVEGLDDISIKAPYMIDGDWNDAQINYRKWR